VLAAVADALSLLRDSLPIVEDAEQREGGLVTELLATELLLDARLSRLPLLLSPQWDENASLCTE